MTTRLFINGEIITVNKRNEVVEAVAVVGQDIVAVGSTEEILQWQDEQATIVDLQGQTMMPGFIESHIHVTVYGLNQLAVNCQDPSIQSIQDLQQKLKEKVEHTPEGQWVRAWGFNEHLMIEKRFPTKEELDEVSTKHLILISRICGHMSIVNQFVLDRANISLETVDPEGGAIGRDKEGDPNGLLLEAAHMQVYQQATYTRDEIRSAHHIASSHFLEKGITSMHDATAYGEMTIEALREDVEADVIKQRIYAMVGALHEANEVVKQYQASAVCTGEQRGRFTYGPLKLFLDGASSGPTIWTREGYTSDPNNYGIHYYTLKEVEELFIPAHAKGWQLTVHAQGDAAIDQILTCIEKAQRLYPRTDIRHRIEHAGIAQPDLIERMKQLNIVPTPNPAFFYEYGEGYIRNYGDRATQMYPLASYVKANIPATIASDNPVTDFNPLKGLVGAMTRMTETGTIVGPEERISLLEAIRMYTWNAAYASFQEHLIGSIEVGKKADVVILDRSILKTPVEALLEIKVQSTIIDGEIVFSTQPLRSKV